MFFKEYLFWTCIVIRRKWIRCDSSELSLFLLFWKSRFVYGYFQGQLKENANYRIYITIATLRVKVTRKIIVVCCFASHYFKKVMLTNPCVKLLAISFYLMLSSCLLIYNFDSCNSSSIFLHNQRETFMREAMFPFVNSQKFNEMRKRIGFKYI